MTDVRMTDVLVAPVAVEVLASTLACPLLLAEVAFGTRQRDLDVAPGTPVYIYAAPDGSVFKSLLKPGFVTWTGTLGKLVPAVASGPRRGMHPDGSMRPPFAEAYDYHDAAMFWHVEGLRPLAEPIPFARFRDVDGAKLFGGFAPQWVSCGVLVNQRGKARPLHEKRLLRAA